MQNMASTPFLPHSTNDMEITRCTQGILVQICFEADSVEGPAFLASWSGAAHAQHCALPSCYTNTPFKITVTGEGMFCNASMSYVSPACGASPPPSLSPSPIQPGSSPSPSPSTSPSPSPSSSPSPVQPGTSPSPAPSPSSPVPSPSPSPCRHYMVDWVFYMTNTIRVQCCDQVTLKWSSGLHGVQEVVPSLDYPGKKPGRLLWMCVCHSPIPAKPINTQHLCREKCNYNLHIMQTLP